VSTATNRQEPLVDSSRVRSPTDHRVLLPQAAREWDRPLAVSPRRLIA